jgi:hypothetical protein
MQSLSSVKSSVLLEPDSWLMDSSGQVFGSTIFGRPGALFYAWIVSLSCLGALHATVFSMGRLTQAAGARRYLPALLKTDATLTKQDQSMSQNLGDRDASTNTMYQVAGPNKGQDVPRYNPPFLSMFEFVKSICAGCLLMKSIEMP